MVNAMKLSIVQILFASCIFTLQVKFQYAAEVEIHATGKMKMGKKSPKDPKSKPDSSDGFQNGKDKPEVGLCSAAGTFAASIVGGGIMRGFQKSKIIDDDGKEVPALSRFDYMVGASGGLNPIFIYGYAQNTTSDEILDADGISDPSLLTEEILNNIPEKSLFGTFSRDLAPLFLYGITQMALFQKVPFVAVVEKMVLEPFKIWPDHPIGQTRDGVNAELITTASIVGPLDAYPEWRIDLNKKFLNLLQEGDRFVDFGPLKYLPSNDEIWDIIKDSNFKVPFPIFMTSKEFTLPTTAFKALLDHPVDNLEFEPMSLPLDQVQHEGDGPFTVSKMLGIGTNLITMIIYKNAIPEFARNLLDIPLLLDIPDKNGKKQEMVVSDGGFNDWEGMLALLKKNVTQIVCGIYKTADRVNTNVEPWVMAGFFIQDYFGVVDSASYQAAFNASQFEEEERLTYPNLLHLEHSRRVFNIFSNGENQFAKLREMYRSLYLAGEPLIATLENLEVVENKLWGIEGGMKVNVTFVSTIGVPKKFSEQIPEDLIQAAEGENFITEYGYFTNEDFQYFPGFNLGNQLTLDIDFLNISLPVGIPDFQVPTKFARLLEILPSWMVERAWDGLRGDDGEIKFGGFKNILS